MFYLLIFSIFFITPITHLGEWISIVFNLILTLAFLLSISVNQIKETLFYKFLVFFTLFNFVVYAVELFYRNTIHDILSQIVFIIFIMLAMIHYGLELYKDKQFTFRRIQGGVIIYILIGVAYYKIYYAFYLFDTSNFAFNANINPLNIQMNLFYFSFTTLTTVGFGDIAANSPITKPIVISQALLGQLYPVIFLARIVSLEIESNKERNKSNSLYK